MQVIEMYLSYYTHADYETFDSMSFEFLMKSRGDTLLESSSTLTLSGKIEQLSEAECQQRIKRHQEKAQRLLEAAQRVCG